MSAFDKVPLPQDLDAERSVLGAMLLSSTAAGEALEVLRPGTVDLFVSDAHQAIFDAMAILYSEGHAIDAITLKDQLAKEKKLDFIGGISYLSDVAGAVPTTANVDHYARIVSEHYKRRGLMKLARHIYSQASTLNVPIAEVMDLCESGVFDLSQYGSTKDVVAFRDLVDAGLERLEAMAAAANRGVIGVPSGFPGLDGITGGFRASDMVIIAARPSVGKSAFVMNVCIHVSHKHQLPVALFSCEMSTDQVFDRAVGIQTGMDLGILHKGFASAGEVAKAKYKRDELKRSKLFIDDTPNISVLDMRSRARRLASREPLSLVVVDYLQLMSSARRHENRQQEVSEISRSLKALARELKCPVIALSQLSREAEKSETKGMHHLRESGAIEQDADVVIILDRKGENNSDKTEIEVNVTKQRNGPLGKVHLFFEPKTQRFRSFGHESNNYDAPREKQDDTFVEYQYDEPDEDIPF